MQKIKRKDFKDNDFIFDSPSETRTGLSSIQYRDVKRFVNRIVRMETRKDWLYFYVAGIEVYGEDNDLPFHYFKTRPLGEVSEALRDGITIIAGLRDFELV